LSTLAKLIQSYHNLTNPPPQKGKNLFSFKVVIITCFMNTSVYCMIQLCSVQLTQPIQLKQVWTCSQGHYLRADIHQRGATLPIRP
jgi:hypothetical protein